MDDENKYFRKWANSGNTGNPNIGKIVPITENEYLKDVLDYKNRKDGVYLPMCLDPFGTFCFKKDKKLEEYTKEFNQIIDWAHSGIISMIDAKQMMKNYWCALQLIPRDLITQDYKQEILDVHEKAKEKFFIFPPAKEDAMLEEDFGDFKNRMMKKLFKTKMDKDREELEQWLKTPPKGDAPKTKENLQEKPAYIKKMIDKGLLYPDGKRVTTKLEDVAGFLRDERIPVTANFLEESFLQPNGKSYSESACKNALNLINTNK